MDENNQKLLIEEVKVIQEIIKRMASNSFSIKTWTVTLIVVALIFRSNESQIFIAFIPLLAFWYLDAYYLKQERLYRKKHSWLVDYRKGKDDRVFELTTSEFEHQVDSIFKTMWSVSILPFYGSIVAVLISYISFLNWEQFVSYIDCILSCVGDK